MKFHPIQVNTYSGYKADEKPLKFAQDGKDHKIREIINQTRVEIVGNGLQSKFTVRTEKGKVFVLFHEEINDQWYLEE